LRRRRTDRIFPPEEGRVVRFVSLVVLAAPLLAVACTGGTGSPPSATLPPDAVIGAGDPTRAAIFSSAYVFGAPSSIAGRPDLGAAAAAQVEHLASEIPTGPRWVGFGPQVGLELIGARQEVRAALGIAPEAPPQEVVDALYAAYRAWRAGDAAGAERALSGPAFRDGGRRTLLVLAGLPPLPRTQVATVHAQFELERLDREGDRQNGGGDAGKD
jgi:hypothetical protein